MSNLKPTRGARLSRYRPDSRGLVADYLLNAGTGRQAFDYSRNGNNGAINGASWEGSPVGPVLDMDYNGSDLRNVVVSANPALQFEPSDQFTLIIWFQVNAYGHGSNQILLQYRRTYLYLNDGVDDRLSTFLGGALLDSGVVPDTGVLHQAGLVYNNGTLTIGLDGEFLASASRTLESEVGFDLRFGGATAATVLEGFLLRNLIFLRAFSEAEFKDNFIDPYAMYEQPSPVRYFFVPPTSAPVGDEQWIEQKAASTDYVDQSAVSTDYVDQKEASGDWVDQGSA